MKCKKNTGWSKIVVSLVDLTAQNSFHSAHPSLLPRDGTVGINTAELPDDVNRRVLSSSRLFFFFFLTYEEKEFRVTIHINAKFAYSYKRFGMVSMIKVSNLSFFLSITEYDSVAPLVLNTHCQIIVLKILYFSLFVP